ncbi:MAG: hypothetical protein ABW023_16480 [Sphingomonas sp.]
MTLLCSIAGHSAETTHRRNQGLDFSLCHHCGCDLIRTAHGDWTQVPKGMRVVWREPARFGDGPSVRDRFDAMGRPPRRREARNARPAPRRDPRGRPLEGATAMFGILANLGKFVSGDIPDDVQPAPAYTKPIHLPGTLH